MYSILYTDDEPGLLNLGKVFLERTGLFTVETALSAEDGLQVLKTRPIDCIVSDYQMPVMDGLKFLKFLRNQKNPIPFILFTGRGREEVVIEALNNGADYYLQKGGDPLAQFAELSHKIRLAIESRRTALALAESERRYRDVVEDQTEFITRFRPDGTHVFVNNAYCKIFNKTPAEIIGTQFRPRVHGDDARLIHEHLQNLTPGQPFATLEHRIILPDGSVRWHQWSDRAIFDETGTLLEYQSVGRDITDKKRAEDEIRAAYEQLTAAQEELRAQYDELHDREQEVRLSERKLQGIVHGSPIPQFVIDKDHRVISWNKALEEASGVMAEDVLGTTDAWRAFYPVKRPVLAELLVDGTPEKVPDWYSGKFARSRYVKGAFEAIDFFTYPGKAGVWLYFTATAIRDEDGKNIGAVETLEDITALKEKEVAVTEARNFLDKIINSIGDPVFVKDRDHQWVLMNDEMCRFMGYPREMLVGKSDYDFFPKQEADVFWQKDEIVFSGVVENINEEQFTDAQGKTHTIVTKKTLYTDAAGSQYIVGVIRDITGRKQTEQKLLDSERKFRAIFNQTYQFTGLMTTDGVLVDANRSALEFSGIPESAVIGKPFWETPWWTHSPELQQKVRDAITNCAQGGFSRFEATHLDSDGGLHYVDFSLKPVRDTHGRVIWLIPEGRDITERKKAEAALGDSEERYRQLVEHSPDAIAVHSGGKLVYINPSCVRMFGAARADEVIGRPVLDFVHPAMRDTVVQRIRIMTDESQNVPLLEEKFLRVDGSPIDVEVAAMPIVYDGKPAVQVAFRDISDRKKAEETLRLNAERNVTLLKLNQMTGAAEQELLQFAFDEGIRLTGSKVGYLAALNDDETVLTMLFWSRTAMEQCRVAEKPIVYPLKTTGLWGEAVRLRRPIITNDYAAPNPLKKGIPDGHVRLTRHMNIPVFAGSKIVLIAGVGNKEEDYTEADVQQLTLLMEGMWRIVERKKATDETESARRHLDSALRFIETVVSAVPTPLFYKDREGRYIAVNNAFADLMGYTPEYYKGKTVMELWPGEYAEVYHDKDLEVMRRAEKQVYEFKVVDKNGTEHPAIWSKNVFRDEKGEVAGIVGAFIDITERKRAEESLRASEERYHNLFEDAGDIIAILDAGGIFLDLNRKFEEESGYARAGILGKTIPSSGFTTPNSAAMLTYHFRQLFRGNPVPIFQIVAIHKDGTKVEYEVRLSPLKREGKIEAAQAVLRNLSERKRAEEAPLVGGSPRTGNLENGR